MNAVTTLPKLDYSTAAHYLDFLRNRLPDPTGYHLLVALPEKEEKTSGGIYLPEQVRDRESFGSDVALVLKLGSEAYADPSRFPKGNWCNPGDWVAIPRYGGTRHEPKIDGTVVRCRFLADDAIVGVIVDPASYLRSWS